MSNQIWSRKEYSKQFFFFCSQKRNPNVPTLHFNYRFFEIEVAPNTFESWFGGGTDLTPYYLDEEVSNLFPDSMNRLDSVQFKRDLFSAWIRMLSIFTSRSKLLVTNMTSPTMANSRSGAMITLLYRIGESGVELVVFSLTTWTSPAPIKNSTLLSRVPTLSCLVMCRLLRRIWTRDMDTRKGMDLLVFVKVGSRLYLGLHVNFAK